MEMNTSERRINKEVVEIFENAKLKYAIEEVTKSYRYQLIKLADAADYLGPKGFKDMVEALEPFLEKIEQGRVKDGKTPGNDYIVINQDEPYIKDIIAILAANGHWEGEVDADNTLNRYKTALQTILEEEAPQCEGYETTVFKLAREALGISAADYWHEENRCDWCGTETDELSGPHALDYVPGKHMCRKCWEHDRAAYLGTDGVDIGEFKARGSE